MRIGNYEIEEFDNESFFIRVAEGPRQGEGMQINKKILEDMIDQFYQENF